MNEFVAVHEIGEDLPCQDLKSKLISAIMELTEDECAKILKEMRCEYGDKY